MHMYACVRMAFSTGRWCVYAYVRMCTHGILDGPLVRAVGVALDVTQCDVTGRDWT